MRCSTSSPSPRTSIAKATRRKRSRRSRSSSISIPRTSRRASSSPSCTRRKASSRTRSTEFSVACEQLRRQGRQDDFVKVAERLLWHQPDNHALNRELAGLYLRRNDPRRALQKLQACFKADPRDVETLGLLAQAFQALDQKAKTVSVLKELARIHVENKQRDKANEVYPQDPRVRPERSRRARLRRHDAGAAAAARAAAAAPGAARRCTCGSRRRSRPRSAPRRTTRSSTSRATCRRSPPSTRMTGSMPLVDEQSLSGVDFALPEYDDADFSADMEPPPDPRRDERRRRAPRRRDLQDPRRDRRLREVRPAPEGRRSPAPRVHARRPRTSRRTSGSRTSSSRRAASRRPRSSC